MKTQLPRRAATLLSCLALLSGPALAGMRMDGLLVNAGPSPCLAVRVRVFSAGPAGAEQPLSELTVGQSGVVKVAAGDKGAGSGGPVFAKGQSYRLQGSCVGGGDSAQGSGLTFTADGRTVILVFTDSGFQFKRGGVAY